MSVRRRGGVVVAFVGVIAVLVAAWWISTSSLFSLRTLHVEGASGLPPGAIEQAAGLSPATNLVWLSTGALARRLDADPRIASSQVERVLPSTLFIRVTERSPVAIFAAGGRRLAIASDGTVMGPPPAGALLPVLPETPAGQGLRPGDTMRGGPPLEAAATLPREIRAQVARISWGPGGTLELSLRTGTLVRYGLPDDLRAKAATLAAVLEWARGHDVRPKIVDVRAPLEPALLPAGGLAAGRGASTAEAATPGVNGA